MRIGGLYQGEFPRPKPALDPLLAQDGLVDVAVGFVPDQLVRSALAAVAVDLTVFVLVDAPDEVVGHADVEPAAGSAGDDVDPVVVVAHGRPPCAISGLSRDRVKNLQPEVASPCHPGSAAGAIRDGAVHHTIPPGQPAGLSREPRGRARGRLQSWTGGPPSLSPGQPLRVFREGCGVGGRRPRSTLRFVGDDKVGL